MASALPGLGAPDLEAHSPTRDLAELARVAADAPLEELLRRGLEGLARLAPYDVPVHGFTMRLGAGLPRSEASIVSRRKERT
jgi:hypothetical protein